MSLTTDELKKSYLGSDPHAPKLISARDSKEKSYKYLTATASYIANKSREALGEAASEQLHLGEEELSQLIHHVEQSEGEILSSKERELIITSLKESLTNYDILTPLIEDERINDIIIRSHNDISVQINKENFATDLSFASRETYLAFVENIAKRAGKSCTTSTPVVDATLDLNVRICITHESFSPIGEGPMLTIRISRHKDVSIESLAFLQFAPKRILQYISTAIGIANATALISGEVSTGKTTLLRAICRTIPKKEAILCIEDTQEINLQRSFVRCLLTREANTEGSGRISPAKAIRTGMRMAMNRIVLGEMRDAEAAEAFIDVSSSGHSGLSTIHARSIRHAITRLELFLARAQPGVQFEAIRGQIANSISLIISVGIDKITNKRRIMEVVEIENSGDSGIQCSPIFRFDNNSPIPRWQKVEGISQWHEELKKQNISLPRMGSFIYPEPQ